MSNSFFVSRELEDVVTPDTLSGSDHMFPYVCIHLKNYNVNSVDNRGPQEIKLTFTCDESFNISDQITIQSGNVFGLLLKNIVASFERLYYDSKQKKHICEIVIDKEKFWS